MAKTEDAKDIQVNTVRSMLQHMHAELHMHQMIKLIAVSSAKWQ